ncbi:MAG: LytTR family transcriptional regulator DNA-binding domain-containing protein [Ginsengibacter sp.]
MLSAILIEDEKPAMDLLADMLDAATTNVNIVAKLNSVKDSIEYITTHPPPDVVFSDVQLNDGLSFEIFKQTGVQVPVIFTTGYDEFMMLAFENNGIDYLLKPISKPDLDKAILKYQRLKVHFSQTSTSPEEPIQHASIDNLVNFLHNRKKTRLLVKKGTENIALKLEDITLFYTENKVVYVIDKCSKKYISDKTLTELEDDLDKNVFFRANRQYIININYIRSFKPFEKVKLAIDLNIPDINHSITISQETAPSFRKWMYEA